VTVILVIVFADGSALNACILFGTMNPKKSAVVRSLLGMWLGLWTIAGVATFAAGLFMLPL
jgi:hypothetical protein